MAHLTAKTQKNAIEDAPVIHTRHATWLVRQERLDGGPFKGSQRMIRGSVLGA